VFACRHQNVPRVLFVYKIAPPPTVAHRQTTQFNFGFDTPLAMVPFTQEQKEIINANPVAKIVDEFRDGLPTGVDFDQYIASAASNAGTYFKLGGGVSNKE
jgi:hypothetical protein